jgi:eukaryotic-like serine/threonine-protein kinase
MDVVEFGDYRFDRANQLLSRDGEELPLPPRALGVLSRLLDEPGSVVSKQTLLETVWNGAYVTETSLSEAVGLLREALQDAAQEPAYIQTVHRRGYRFIAPVRVPEEPAPAPPPPPSPPQRGWLHVIAAVTIPALLLATLGIVAFTRTSRTLTTAPPVVARFAVAPPPPYALLDGLPTLAISRDGRHLVYTARRGTEHALFHRDLSTFTSREIAGTRGALLPFFSPDGRRVGFFLDHQLVAVPLAGGAPLPLTSIRGAFWGAGWSEDGSIVYASGATPALFRVRPGGAAERLTETPAARSGSHRWPHLLPGGKAVLFTEWTATIWDARVEWLSLVTGERRTVMTGAADCRYADGMLVCAQAGGTIVVARFDPDGGKLTGPPLPLLRDAAIDPMVGYAQLAAGGRTLIYLTGERDFSLRTLQRLDASGNAVPLPVAPRVYRSYQEGPGGAVVVTVVERGRSDVWVLAANGKPSRLTFERFNVEAIWSPDGQWVAYASREPDGVFHVYRRRADGSGAAERLLETKRDQAPEAWSPDGRELLIRETHPATGYELWILDLATRKARPWQRATAKAMSGMWSPDGKWIAYSTSETGRYEIYVRRYPHGEGRWQVSLDGGEYPSWSADGRTIYFHRRRTAHNGAELWSVPVEPRGNELTVGTPVRIFTHPLLIMGAGGPGGVLLLSEAAPAPKPAEVRVLLDWPEAVQSLP